MVRFRSIIASFSVCIILEGCAVTTAIPVAPDDKTTSGFRYAEAKPILIVTADGPEIAFIPNTDRMYAVQFHAFLAKNTSSLTLSNGMLTKVDVDLDSTAIIELLSKLLDKLAPDAVIPNNAGQQTGGGELLQVYDFVFDGNGNLVALKKLVIS